jgi:hypothetical protein
MWPNSSKKCQALIRWTRDGHRKGALQSGKKYLVPPQSLSDYSAIESAQPVCLSDTATLEEHQANNRRPVAPATGRLLY